MSMPPQQPPGWQQGPWPLPATPARRPRQEQHRVKWLLIAVAVLLVVGVTIGATLLFSRGNGGGTSTTSSSAPPSDVASANDRGAVAIITQEPTCQTFLGINDGLANVQKRGWAAERATLGPAAEWTPDQRSQVQVVTTAMRNAAEQSVALAKQTPHRVIRQLYEQFIAYGRAYADSLPTYTPTNNGLASANVNASSQSLASAMRFQRVQLAGQWLWNQQHPRRTCRIPLICLTRHHLSNRRAHRARTGHKGSTDLQKTQQPGRVSMAIFRHQSGHPSAARSKKRFGLYFRPMRTTLKGLAATTATRCSRISRCRLHFTSVATWQLETTTRPPTAG